MSVWTRSWGMLFLIACTQGALAQQKYYQVTNLWRAYVGYGNQSSPALDRNGVIYVTAWEGRLYAVNAKGESLWNYQINSDVVSSPAVGEDGTVYFGARDHRLYAIGSDGQKKWSFRTGRWVDASPALGAEGTIYFGSWDGNFYALTRDGTEKWRFQTGGPVVSSAAIGATGDIFFGSHDRKLYALNAAGQKLWEFPTHGAIISSPTLGRNGEVYFTSVDGKLYALNAAGAKQWELPTGSITASSPVLDESGNLYLCANTNFLAISPAGKMIWQRRTWDHPEDWLADSSGMVLANGQIIFSTRDARVIALRPDSDWEWLFWLDGSSLSSPLVGPDGIIYAMGLHTGLNALPRDVPLAATPWPMFRANPQRTGRVLPVN